MKPLLRLLFAFVVACVIGACGNDAGQTQAPEVLVDAKHTVASNSADESASEGIHWFEGSVEQAFSEAKAQQRPLFLYWGAKWCPPCHELKATVFSRPDFVKASRQFVAIYIDGDDVGAQRYAEQFGVIGYPTLVVFDADGAEHTRIPNGLDLQAYASVLQNVLDQVQPVADIVAAASEQGGQLSAQQCQALVNHSWQQDPQDYTPEQLAEVFEAASNKCPTEATIDRDALYLMQLQQQHAAQQSLSPAEQQNALGRVTAMLQQDGLVKRNFYLLLDSGAALTELLTAAGSEEYQQLQGQFIALYTRLSQQGERSPLQRLQAMRSKLDLLGLEEGQALSDELQQEITRLRSDAEKMDRTNPQFHATINATGNLLREAGLLTQAKELLSEEIKQSKYAYYFMGELAHIENLLGNQQQSLHWLRKAFDDARGPATRFQWGVSYLSGLLEMTADDLPAINQGFDDVFAELFNSRAFYQRSRIRLQRLDNAMQEWAMNSEPRQAALQVFRQKTMQVCAKIPSSDAANKHCTNFLSGATLAAAQ